jgi:hypothetical protein
LTFGSLQSARDAVDFDTPAALDTSSNVTDGRTSCSLLAFVIMSLPFENHCLRQAELHLGLENDTGSRM